MQQRAPSTGLSFGICIGPVDAPGTSDAALYTHALDDAALAESLGYAGVWALEHHFSDYYPTPDPLMFLAHVAGRHPTLELGTMVIVAPWYHPLRLAENIAMLSLLSRADLHLGLGRGSAASEYEAFGLELDESRERFGEILEIVNRALAGGGFTYRGKFYDVPNEIELRPRPERSRIHLYGAISTPPSAAIMAKLGLPPLSNAFRPLDMHRAVLDDWRRANAEAGGRPDPILPIQAHLIIADTDAEADRIAREVMPPFFQAQVKHYQADLDRYKHLKSYDFARIHGVRIEHSDPRNLDQFNSLQFFGSPGTIRRQVERYAALGFNKFIVTVNTPDIPKRLRHEWLTRFAREVAPEFAPQQARRRSAA
ncbi:MAG: LLM class flavin-dependent oxidoreductase [Rhodospirillaceae bacterium]|nr:LLM class flavin-dependent oxidoreductase [Rhodospirillaceae bacterium]